MPVNQYTGKIITVYAIFTDCIWLSTIYNNIVKSDNPKDYVLYNRA